MEKCFVVLVFILTVVNAFYIKSNLRSSPGQFQGRENEHSPVIDAWMKYKRKLQSFSTYLYEEDTTGPKSEHFSELEVLELIPTIIGQYRDGKISTHESTVLSHIYGKIWDLMVQEAKRQEGEQTNPVLKSLLDSLYLLREETDTINIVATTNLRKPARLPLQVNKNDHPAQRVLNAAAMLILYNRNVQPHVPEREVASEGRSFNPAQGAEINFKLLNTPASHSARTKRDIKIHITGNDLLDSRIEAILRMTDDDDDDNDENDDYDEYYEISSGPKTGLTDIYEDDYEYDEKFAPPGLITKSDNGSVRELIFLAAKHRLRREKEERKLKASRKLFLTLKSGK